MAEAIAPVGMVKPRAAASAMVLSRMTDTPVRELMVSGPDMNPDLLAHLMIVVQGAQGRHREVTDPVEVLAAFGGFEDAAFDESVFAREVAERYGTEHVEQRIGIEAQPGAVADQPGERHFIRSLGRRDALAQLRALLRLA